MNQEKPIHEFDNDEIEINLGELISVLLSRIYMIFLAGIIVALIAFIFTKVFITPMYTSSTSMYILTRSDNTAGLTNTDLQTGTQLTQDYMELVGSRTVLEQVIDVLDLDMTTEKLEDSITTENKENTRILTISVENEDPQMAKDIADALREASSITIRDIMEIDAVNTIEEANLPVSPSSPSVMKNTAIGGLIGLVLAIGAIVLIYILDDTIKTPDDVEKYLGLNVLTSIPIQEDEPKVKKTNRRSTRNMTKKIQRRR